MSRHIDANALKKTIDKEIFRYDTIDRVFQIIDDAPSIDIVRCGECKWLRYCETEDLNMFLTCDHPDGGGIPRNEEWFCADGEREGE